MQIPPIEVKEFFARRRTIQAFYEQYGGLTIYRSVNNKNIDELLYLVSPTEGLKGLLKQRASCKSPHLGRVLEIGKIEDTSHPYWVCALDLASKYDELLSEQQHRPRRICQLLIHIAKGINVLHEHGLYHGDIRAGNVWVRIRNNTEEAFLVGVAIDQWAGVVSSASPTVEQARYMAPEKTMGESSSQQSDIYSLAVLIYRSLSGSYPFDGTEPFSITAAHATETVPTPIPAFDDPLWEVLLQAMDKNPENRPASVQLFIDILEEYANGKNVQKQSLQDISSSEEPTPSLPLNSVAHMSADQELVIEEPLSDAEEWTDNTPIEPESVPDERNFISTEEHLISDDEHQFTDSIITEPQEIDKTESIPTPVNHEEVPVFHANDADSETVHNVEYSEHNYSEHHADYSESYSHTYNQSGFEPDTFEYDRTSEDSEDITVVPAKIRLELPQGDLEVPSLKKAEVISPPPIVHRKAPKILLDELSPLASFEESKEEEQDVEIEETSSIEVDIRKLILFGLFCFVMTLLLIYVVRN